MAVNENYTNKNKSRLNAMNVCYNPVQNHFYFLLLSKIINIKV
jgi:hypothetical protein